MSTDADRKKSRLAAAAFVALLALSVWWPSPVVSSNALWLHRDLSVDELSFLGREAPAWDVMFWCLAGLFALVVLQTGTIEVTQLRAIRVHLTLSKRFWLGVVATALIVAAVWLLFDRPALAIAEGLQSDTSEDIVRIANRLGGGMNPPLIVIFFLVAGVVYRQREWVRYAIAMALAGAAAGILAQLIKFVVGRTRPELWLGAFHYARGGANSFPSGHTVGAFALGGVLLFASRNPALRVAAILLAIGVGLARIMAFRHWPSDVVASAAIGLLAAYASTSAKFTDTRREHPASSIVTP